MGLIDILNGMQNGPRGQRLPNISASSGKGGGMSPIMMALLGLLAYNIGPRNGGLQAIMARYGARDFVTIQPYLQELPRDYPIRVLAAALAYRLWLRDGRLPKYEEADNAASIQAVGIPGLQ